MDLAVCLQNVCFEYNNNIRAIDDLTLKVPRGQIFALLGPNGCGKTTTIRLILGRLKAKSGQINVFGNGASTNGVSSLHIGYMPQELALFEEFTIEEILKYYGTIYHLQTKQMSQTINHLIDILDLPEKSRTINRLSGGQQRRVSIAITMIHRPKLIILDEPTVGVDSLLRKKIWNYLEEMCDKFNQTVIITTHYIEEARSAPNIAFMTSGAVLKQTNPLTILEEYNCKTLEEVFIKLCYQKRAKNIGDTSVTSDTSASYLSNEVHNQTEIESLLEEKLANNSEVNVFVDLKRVEAMLSKYFILSLRRPLFLVMFYLIPILALTSMKLSIGQSPYGIPIAVYNGDENPILSQLFLDSIDKNYLNLNLYNDNQTAQQTVINGYNYMSIGFTKRFSETFESRAINLFDMNAKDLGDSEIKLRGDLSNTALVLYIFKYIFDAFEKFSLKVSKKYGYDIYKFLSPISVEPPIYGDLDLNVTAHFGPSIMIVLAQTLPMILSALQIIYDRKNSSLERVFVAGVKPIEFFIAHIIQNSILIISLIFFSMFISFVVFDNKQLGSHLEVYILLVLQGILGMAIGLMGALILFDEVSVAVGISGLMLPLWIMSGVLWPLESMPPYFRYVSHLSPITQPLEALRSIMLRGWTYNRHPVLNGHLINKAFKLNIWNFSYK